MSVRLTRWHPFDPRYSLQKLEMYDPNSYTVTRRITLYSNSLIKRGPIDKVFCTSHNKFQGSL
jgi:hypothetical protein